MAGTWILTIWLSLLAVSAFAESTLAVVGAQNGLYMSRDRGRNWEKNDAMGEDSVHAAAIDRSNLNCLYAATADGLLISRDGGASWSRGNFPAPKSIQKLMPAGAGAVFALADNALWFSSNGGLDWVAESGIPVPVFDLAVDAGDPPTVYAVALSGIYRKANGGTWAELPGSFGAYRIAADPDQPGHLFRASGATIAHTTDGGASWTELPPIPQELAADAVGFASSGDYETKVEVAFMALAPGARGTDVIAQVGVCITWDGSFIGCSWAAMSTRNGEWRTGTPLNRFLEAAAMGGDRSANLAMVGGVPYKTPYVNGFGLYYSNLTGDGWVPAGAFDRVAVNCIAIGTIDVETGSRAYAATSEGLFSSNDSGETWELDATLGKTKVFATGVNPSNADLILASTSEGLYRSTDGGASWEKGGLPSGIWASVIAFDPKKDGRAYLVDSNSVRSNPFRLWTTEDYGESWHQVAGQPEGILDLALDSRTTPAAIYVAGVFGIKKSTDEGETWKAIYTYWIPTHLVRLGEPAGTIYRDGEDGLWKSLDDGETWAMLGPPLRIVAAPPEGMESLLLWEWIELEALAIGSGRNDRLVAGCLTYFAWFFSIGPGDMEVPAAFTLDADGWHANPGAIGSCKAVQIDPRAADVVYAGGYGSFQRSTDGGRSWAQVPGFDKSIVVYSIAVAPLAVRKTPAYLDRCPKGRGCILPR